MGTEAIEMIDAIIAAARVGAEQPVTSDPVWNSIICMMDDIAHGWFKQRTERESLLDCACRLIRECFAERGTMKRRVHDPDYSDDCPFCKTKPQTPGIANPMCHLCELESERDALRARVAELEAKQNATLTLSSVERAVESESKGHSDDVHVSTRDDGWIPWHGGECPVDRKSLIEVKYSSQDEHPWEPEPAGIFRWDHAGLPCDIIAYHVTKFAEHPTREEILAAYEAAGIVPEKWPWICCDQHGKWFACGREPMIQGTYWNVSPWGNITLPPVADWKRSKRRVVP